MEASFDLVSRVPPSGEMIVYFTNGPPDIFSIYPGPYRIIMILLDVFPMVDFTLLIVLYP